MLPAKTPANEPARLRALHRYQVLDTEAEQAFDALVALASHLAGVPVSLISLVDADRQWFKAVVGLEDRETPRSVSFCAHVVSSGEPLVVEDARLDERFFDNPLVIGSPHVRFYAGVPLRTPDGFVLGTLCVIDHERRALSPEALELLERLADQTIALLEARQTARRLEQTLELVRLERENLHAVLDLMAVGVVALDEEGRVRFLSRAAQSLLGADPAGSLDRAWDTVLPGGARDLGAQLRRPERARERVVVAAHTPSGRHRQLEVEVRDDPRTPGSHLVFLRDVTETQAAREARNRLEAGQIAGSDPATLAVLRTVREVAAGHWSTLIEGETGTGKELVARAIHAASPRALGPFIAVNCASLSETLLSSQLFGHKRGSFTGAVADQEGLFEAARGGTLFLDEIGDMPLALQGHLLRVLQEKEVVRVGETRPRKVDARVLAATHRDLEAEAAAGRFRADLLYRLRVGRVRVPPLRDRPGDLRPLAYTFLAETRGTCGKLVRDFEAAALEALVAYRWPGNVRELRSAIEHAVIHCRGELISVADLPVEVRSGEERRAAPVERHVGSIREALQDDERQRIFDALRRARGNRQEAARLLGMSRATFYRHLAALDIKIDS